MLGVLHHTSLRSPQLSAVADLVAVARRGDQHVALDNHLPPTAQADMSDAAQLAAFRVVQEGLTNARKHATDQTVHVELAAVPEQIGPHLPLHHVRLSDAIADGCCGGQRSHPVPV